jgi:hypothetical protein
MTRNSILAGLTASIAVMAVAAPAAHAQEITPTPTPTPVPFISPANPESPKPTVGFGDCKVSSSTHGYAYAVCSVNADNVPYGQTITVGYRSNLQTFKPRTKANWGTQAGTLRITNNEDGEDPGTGNFSATIKVAFKGRTALQLIKQLNVSSTGSSAEVIQPTAKVVGA